MPKSYLAAFRRQVINLIDSDLSVSEVLSRVGLSESIAYRWWRREQISRGVIDDSEAIPDDWLREASRRIRDLEEEVKILRKAAGAVEEAVRPKNSILRLTKSPRPDRSERSTPRCPNNAAPSCPCR
jgi:transposase-like protein